METTHTPQGDGNISFSPWISIRSASKQPTPRKGTETKSHLPNNFVGHMETTHTPQGDGHALSTIQSPQSYRNNPHPARGRKLADLQLAGRDDLKHLHPARGRKRNDHVFPLDFLGTNLHPARGRKHPLYVLVEIRHRNTSHPARGRKPCHCCIFCFT